MCDAPAVHSLYLQNNKISDPGVTALANACASGSLAKLTNVILWGNPGTLGAAAREL